MSGGIAPRILNLGPRWRWEVNFIFRPLYPRYPLCGRLGGAQSRSERTVLGIESPVPTHT